MRKQAAVSRLISRTNEVEVDTTNILEKLPASGGFAWLREGLWMAGWGEAIRIDPGWGPGRFNDAASNIERLFDRSEVEDEVRVFGSGPVAFGSFSFDERASGSALVVPEVVIAGDGARGWVTVNSLTSADDLPMRKPSIDTAMDLRTWTASEEEWLASAERSIEMLREGRLEKVVLARGIEVSVTEGKSARDVLVKLSQRFPSCFNYGFYNFVGSSPELLVRKTGSSVESIPLAGSALRSRDAIEDESAGDSLFTSDKQRLEHSLAVDSVVSALRQICTKVTVDPQPHLVKLANVQHLGTRVRADCPEASSILRLVGALHPTAAVCGTPREAALDVIRKLEPADRGRYSGPIGWVSAAGDGEWAIALRCAELHGERALVHAGAGLVVGSEAKSELEEIEMKLEAISMALR